LLDSSSLTTVYHLASAGAWGSTFGGRSTDVWLPRVVNADSNGAGGLKPFELNVRWARSRTVIVDAIDALTASTWVPISTKRLAVDTYRFSDLRPASKLNQFHRLRGESLVVTSRSRVTLESQLKQNAMRGELSGRAGPVLRVAGVATHLLGKSRRRNAQTAEPTSASRSLTR